MSQTDWLEVFAKYQASPEYQLVNKGMSLDEFKTIFLWEYGHRMLGRFIGLLFFFPFLYFWLRSRISGVWTLKLIGVFALGGLQGLIGWYMVKSGLVNDPHVSQYRLAAHFGIALIIFVYLVWFALDFLWGQHKRIDAPPVLRRKAQFVAGLVFVMMLTGAFVAGTKAGHIYNTFPLMAGAWVPDGLLAMQPVWRNFFENAMTIQFIHRCLAYCVVLAVLGLFFVGRRYADPLSIQVLLRAVLLLMCVQVMLGIITLLTKVPILWGALHQSTAVALLASVLMLLHRVCRTRS